MVGTNSLPKNLWPLSQFLGYSQNKKLLEGKKDLIPNRTASGTPSGFLDVVDRALIMIPIYAIAYVTEQIYPLTQYMEEAHELDYSFKGWIFKIAVRDLIVSLGIVAGWWTYIEIFCKPYLKQLRFNPEYPSFDELYREVPYTVCTILMGTLFECVALRLYASNSITNYYMDYFSFPLVTFLWFGLLPFWRSMHFYWIHRAIHPWNTVWVPDIGYYLFEYSHYLHHLSTNITVWSSISMHPIEGFLYETACILPCFFFHHPMLIWLVKIDLTLRAVTGHDGYDYPGAGSWFHFVHHQKFNSNYGSPSCGMDWLFGSFDNGIEYRKKYEQTQK